MSYQDKLILRTKGNQKEILKQESKGLGFKSLSSYLRKLLFDPKIKQAAIEVIRCERNN
jgi:hypothetical protein